MSSEPTEEPASVLEQRHATIRAAAVDEFSRRGFAGTSMANIADAAGMSRPALYQYYRNKTDIFASAFIAVIEDHVERALAELGAAGTVSTQLDGFMQRFEGDLWEQLAASPHVEEILSTKSDQVTAGIQTAMGRLWDGLAVYLKELSPGRGADVVGRRQDWVDVLHFSPKGFKLDQPSIDTFRRRLSVLASGIAAEIAQGQSAS